MEAELLEKILHELQQLRQERSPKQALGFGEAPKSEVWVFCNREKEGLWYSLDSQGQAVNIEHGSLTGYIRKLEFTKPTRRGKEVDKLNITIEGDKVYILEAGATVQFAKGLLYAIATIPQDLLEQPITIVPVASTQNDEVLFCNIYQNGKQVYAPYDESTNWKKVSLTAIKAIALANGGDASEKTEATEGRSVSPSVDYESMAREKAIAVGFNSQAFLVMISQDGCKALLTPEGIDTLLSWITPEWAAEWNAQYPEEAIA